MPRSIPATRRTAADRADAASAPVPGELPLAEYRALAELRYQVRRFLRFSEEAARAARLEPQQHQLLLAIKGLPETQVLKAITEGKGKMKAVPIDDAPAVAKFVAGMK